MGEHDVHFHPRGGHVLAVGKLHRDRGQGTFVCPASDFCLGLTSNGLGAAYILWRHPCVLDTVQPIDQVLAAWEAQVDLELTRLDGRVALCRSVLREVLLHCGHQGRAGCVSVGGVKVLRGGQTTGVVRLPSWHQLKHEATTPASAAG